MNFLIGLLVGAIVIFGVIYVSFLGPTPPWRASGVEHEVRDDSEPVDYSSDGDN